ncbi:MAG: FG-GAP-like repeat-containing protein [Candidatus Cryptobacteroides sp.]
MKNNQLLILIEVLFFSAAFTGRAADNNNALSLFDSSAIGDSTVLSSLDKYDFGIPNPNAVNSQDSLSRDYLGTASMSAIRQLSRETIMPKKAMRVMALSDDGAEYAFGQIPYQEEVTEYGGRRYNVPLMITPLANFSPQISLQYNSQSTNGLAGYGWDIGGLSSITIANKNQYYNGKVAPANVNDPDAVYSLDEIPLVQNDDTLSAAEYQLETARGHIIVKKITAGNVISHFVALFPDGSKATYGMTSNTSAKAVYPITAWEDKLGNNIVYNYSGMQSDYRVVSILFRRNGNNSEIGKLTFSYTTRSDCYSRYQAGQHSCQNYILKSVTSESNGEILCKYQLAHSFKEGVNLLTSIGCANATGEQLRPLEFSYGTSDEDTNNISDDFEKTDYLFLSTYFSSSSDVEFYYNRGKYLPDSYNDGLMILPKFNNYGILVTKTNWLGKKTYKFGSKYAADQVVLVAPRLSYLSNVDNSITVGDGFQCIDAADIDGDGVDEIVKVNFNGTSTNPDVTTLRITVYSCDASTGAILQEKYFDVMVNGIVKSGEYVSPVPRFYQLGDFNGDGKTQLLTISYNKDGLDNSRTSYASLIDINSGVEISESNLLSLSPEDKLFCIDIDGDGRTEVCHVTSSGINVYNQSGSLFSLTKTISGVTSTTFSSAELYFLDINGDGYVDIARRPTDTSPYWNIYQYTGETIIPKTITIPQTSEADKYMFFDLNSDGLYDLVKRNSTSIVLYLNDNGTYYYENGLTSSLAFDETAEFVPCNMLGYNAMSDFITVEGSYVNLYKFSQDLSSSRLLTSFTNSLGATTLNNYANMASSNYVYCIDSDRSYSSTNGYAKCRFPLQLLYNTQSYLSPDLNSEEQLTDQWYTYFDACVNTKGLGFCGFGKVRTIDFMGVTNRELVTTTFKNPERMGVTTRIEHGHGLDSPYDITDYTYDSHTTTYGKLNPRLSSVVHTDNLSNRQSIALYSFDTYDFPFAVQESNTIDGSGLLRETRRIE